MKFVIANWKANKTPQEAATWTQDFQKLYKPRAEVSVIVCVSFPLLMTMQAIQKLHNVSVGALDLSRFPAGPYTGEVAATTIAPLASYVVIGHSERRSNLHETEDDIAEKVKQAVASSIEPILCLRNEKDTLHPGVKFVTYEPPSAISTGPVGKNADIQEVLRMRNILNVTSGMKYIYGGSVNPQTIAEYAKHEEIDGYLVGNASLTASTFCEIINAV